MAKFCCLVEKYFQIHIDQMKNGHSGDKPLTDFDEYASCILFSESKQASNAARSSFMEAMAYFLTCNPMVHCKHRIIAIFILQAFPNLTSNKVGKSIAASTCGLGGSSTLKKDGFGTCI